MKLADYIRDIPDFPKPGILFKDITPLLAHPDAFQYAIDQLTEAYRDAHIDAIAAAEARGFLFAAPLALRLHKPMIPLRKPGKLPYHTLFQEYALEYGTATLHMHTDGIRNGQQVLLVDDLLATGGTMTAAAELVRKAGGIIAGYAFVVELLFLHGRKQLASDAILSLVQY